MRSYKSNRMKNITTILEDIYYPQKAIIIYKTRIKSDQNIYVESYDMDDKGRPINARPFNVDEAESLAEVLQSSFKQQNDFLQCNGLFPDNILYLNTNQVGEKVIWFSKSKEVALYFKKELEITSGLAFVPPLLWIANRKELKIYALFDETKPTLETPLYHAPFFNIYSDASVCMGTVDIDMDEDNGLEEFMNCWERYFFESYFSHTMDGHSPVKTNIIQLWKEQVNTKRKFPVEVLKESKKKLKNLLPC